jgi:large subunit ribosomal protein L28
MLAPFGDLMPAQCEICGKQRQVANRVSHSNIKTKKIQRANLHRVHILVGTTRKHAQVCTRCLRSGKVVKAV